MQFWRWQKTPIKKELMVEGETCLDRARNIATLTPDEIEGKLTTDQLYAPDDDELILNKRLAANFMPLQDRAVTVRPFELDLNGKKDNNWIHVSVIGRVLAIDYQQSELVISDTDPYDIRNITRLVLNHANIARSNMDIFRVYGFDEYILVSDRLKRELEASITGVSFIPL